MKRRMYALPVVAMTAAAGVIAAPATSQPPVGGLARAKAAGISVSPEAARIMARAPNGTCMADPAARKCPRVRRIVARAAAATGCRAHAQIPDMSSNTQIYGYGTSSTCGSNTAYNEVTVVLALYNDKRVWQQMSAAAKHTSSNHAVGATAWYTHCSNRKTPVYLWRTTAYSYSKNKSGTGYYNTIEAEKLRPCRPS
jgi:hypothetical protein